MQKCYGPIPMTFDSLVAAIRDLQLQFVQDAAVQLGCTRQQAIAYTIARLSDQLHLACVGLGTGPLHHHLRARYQEHQDMSARCNAFILYLVKKEAPTFAVESGNKACGCSTCILLQSGALSTLVLADQVARPFISDRTPSLKVWRRFAACRGPCVRRSHLFCL